MNQKIIDKLIINKPYEEPKEYWLYIRETQSFERKKGRRKSGYWKVSTQGSQGYDDPGEFVEISLVNRIRPRVKEWRDSNYPNVTGITKQLLNFWKEISGPSEEQKLFWCQIEAVETAIRTIIE